MSRLLLAATVLSSGLLGGYLSPLAGITVFFGLVTLLLVTLPALRLSGERLAALGFATYAAASVFWSVDTWGTVLFAGSLLAGALLFAALGSVRDWKMLLVHCVLAAGVVNGAAETLAQTRLIAHGLFYNANPYSGFQTPVVFFALYLYHRTGKKGYAWAASFLMFSNFISRSRAGIGAMLLGLILLCLYLWKVADKRALLGLARMVGSALAGFLAFTYGLDLLGVVYGRGIVEKGAPPVIQRARILESSLKLVVSSPLFGTGLNSFKGVINRYSSPYVMDPPIHAHSLYLNILVELGIVGLLLFGVVLWLLFRKCRLSPAVFFQVALISFLAHNLVEYNFPAPGFQVLFYLLAALSVEGTEEQSLVTLEGWRARLFRSVVLLYFLLVQAAPLAGFFFLMRANKSLEANDLEGTATNLLRASHFGYAVSITHQHAASFLGGVYLSSAQRDPRLLALVEAGYRKALALNSVDGDLYVKIADFYARLGRRQEAMEYLRKAMECYPYHQKYKIAYAEVIAEDGQYDQALRLLNETNDFLKTTAPLEPARIRALAALSRVHLLKGNEELSRTYAEQAARLRDVVPRGPLPVR